MKRTAGIALTMAVSMLSAGGFARAAEEPDGWSFELTPYAWLMGIDGSIEVGERTVDVKQDFSDLIDHVDGAFSLFGVAQYNRLVMLEQFDYASLSDRSERTTAAGGSAKVEMTSIFSTTAVGYQFGLFGKRSKLDVMAGVRVASFDNEVSVGGLGSVDDKVTIVDPVLVLRPSLQVTDSLRFNPLYSIGGGGDSDLVWEFQPELQWSITDRLALRLGYRTVHYDYDGDRGTSLDLDFKGAVIGIGVTL